MDNHATSVLVFTLYNVNAKVVQSLYSLTHYGTV